MATLFQDFQKSLKKGELDKNVKGDVVVKCLEIIGASPYKVGLSSNGIINASKIAFDLICQTWKQLVQGSKNEDEFNKKLEILCINACQKERRNTGFLNLPMGGYIGTDFPDWVGSC